VDPEEFIQKHAKEQTLSIEMFETIRKLGDGNFTEVFQVYPKKFQNSHFALKICKIERVSSMKRENDVYMEKHALNKIRDTYYDAKNNLAMPTVRLIATFKDQFNLYFLNEMLKSRNEVWEHCRSFGLLHDDLVRYVFYHICL